MRFPDAPQSHFYEYKLIFEKNDDEAAQAAAKLGEELGLFADSGACDVFGGDVDNPCRQDVIGYPDDNGGEEFPETEIIHVLRLSRSAGRRLDRTLAFLFRMDAMAEFERNSNYAFGRKKKRGV